MDNTENENRVLHLVDESVIWKLHLANCSGEQMNDTVVSQIVAYMSHQLRCWKNRQDDTLRAKDSILLCLSTLLSAAKKKLRTNTAVLDAMKDADFGLISELLDCSDMAVSYGTCQCLCQLVSNDSGDLLQCLLMQLVNADSWSGTGWIHRLDLFTYLLHIQQEPDHPGILFNLLGANWKHLVDVVFADDFCSKLGCHHDIVMFSFCRLWSRMIKSCARRPDDSYCASVMDSTSVLLDRLKSGQLPSLCRGKCLAVLMEMVWLDPCCTGPVAMWTLTAAESVLSGLYASCMHDDSLSHSHKDLLFNCCLLVDNDHPSVSGSLTTFGRSESSTADNGLETAHPSSTQSSHGVAVSTGASASAVSENTSVVQNRGLATSEGFCFCHPVLYTNRQLPQEFRNHRTVFYDAKLVRKFVLLVVRCLDVITRDPTHHRRWLSITCHVLKSLTDDLKTIHCCSFIDVFIDRDDFLIESLLHLSNIHSSCQSSLVNCENLGHLHPFLLFLTFLDRTGWNYSLLLDFIMSPETCFLLYLVRTLKNISGSWNHWTDACWKYAPLQKKLILKKGSCQAECGGSANYGDLSARNRKRKQKWDQFDSVSQLETLDTEDQLLDTEVLTAGERMGDVTPSSVLRRAVDTYMEISQVPVSQNAIVDYSASSDEEEFEHSRVSSTSVEDISAQKFRSVTTRYETVIKKRCTDCTDYFVTSDDGHKEETTSVLISCDERTMKKGGSKTSDSSTCRTLHQAMGVLSELRGVISRLVAKNVFPFNVRPLVRHLRRCELLYTVSQDMV